MIVEGLIDLGHAKVILSLEDKELQLKAAQYVVKNSLTVRQTEKLVSDIKENGLEDNITKSKRVIKILVLMNGKRTLVMFCQELKLNLMLQMKIKVRSLYLTHQKIN